VRRVAGLLCALGAAACTGSDAPEGAQAEREIMASGPSTPEDTCGAAPLQRLIGRSWREVDVSHKAGTLRVYPVGSDLIEDFQPQRLNIKLREPNGPILEIWCG
jgi:hypothetical protein